MTREVLSKNAAALLLGGLAAVDGVFPEFRKPNSNGGRILVFGDSGTVRPAVVETSMVAGQAEVAFRNRGISNPYLLPGLEKLRYFPTVAAAERDGLDLDWRDWDAEIDVWQFETSMIRSMAALLDTRNGDRGGNSTGNRYRNAFCGERVLIVSPGEIAGVRHGTAGERRWLVRARLRGKRIGRTSDERAQGVSVVVRMRPGSCWFIANGGS